MKKGSNEKVSYTDGKCESTSFLADQDLSSERLINSDFLRPPSSYSVWRELGCIGVWHDQPLLGPDIGGGKRSC